MSTETAPSAERGADYTDAFAGIDAIEGQGLENPMGSAMPAPAAPAPAAPAPEPQAAAPAAPAPQKSDDLFNLDKLVTPKTEPAAPVKQEPVKAEPSKPEPTSLKQFREQYELTKKERDDLASKIQELERAKADGFALVDLPRATTLLAQGAGRLIRSTSDRGVVAVFDPRMATKSYRWAFVNALPPMRRSKDRAEVEAFLGSLREGGAGE